MSDSFKRLLPAPARPSTSTASPAGQTDSPPGPISVPPVKKRAVSKAACNNCRHKKIRCDGQRPTCGACIRSSTECNYVTATSGETPFMALKREVESLHRVAGEFVGLYDLLRSAPAHTTSDIVRRLRASQAPFELGDDFADRLARIRLDVGAEPSLVARLSNHQLVQTLTPPIVNQTEFELCMLLPCAYSTVVPHEVAFGNLADVLNNPAPVPIPDSVDPASSAGDTTEPPRLPTSVASTSRSTPEVVGSAAPERPRQPSAGGVRFGKQGTASSAGDIPLRGDDRLERLNISKWTDVPITDELAATLISMYLTIDRPYALFDADLFLEDLISGRTHFCTRFLLNSLLSWACQSYSNLQPEIGILAASFEREAETLWAKERLTNTLTAVAGAQLLSNSTASRGRKDISVQCSEESIRMGQRMGLFGVQTKEDSALTWLDHHEDWLRMACHTSWGTFISVCIRSLQCHAGLIAAAPLLPLPGETLPLHQEPATPEGEPSMLVPSTAGEGFRAMCDLSLIVHDIIWAYFSFGDGIPAERATAQFADHTFSRLYSWAAKLPIILARGSSNPSFFLALHIHAASMNQLKRLALTGRFQSDPLQHASILCHIGVLYLASGMLTDYSAANKGKSVVQDPECRFYFLLCLAENVALCRSFRVVEMAVLGLLNMALRADFLSPAETKTILRDMCGHGQKTDPDDVLEGCFVVDFDTAMTAPAHAHVQSLADGFCHRAASNDFTHDELR
ncbi:hypothetical protein GGR56DRAFT_663953 [Xylariaceae sp. FL0804]|nr:hypothetical protein GGR56DRAFT_663953 [Xylariaceae sp. FL0804]